MRPKAATQTLEARSIYILPTRYGIFFAIMLLCMLLGSINYSSSLGFFLTFLLAGLGLVGMLYTFRNLAYLKISHGHTKPVFAGETAEVPLLLTTTHQLPAYQISVGQQRRSPSRKINVFADSNTKLIHNLPAQQRGYATLGRLRVWSTFPLGLFHVWSWVELDHKVLVYPKPSGLHKLPHVSRHFKGHNTATYSGNEDFIGVRPYQAGDSPKHIAWKASAKSHEVLTKQFADLASHEVWLDWEDLDGLSIEQRLSQLCQWVLDMYYENRGYGLKLPDATVNINQGELHRAVCLEKLALFKP